MLIIWGTTETLSVSPSPAPQFYLMKKKRAVAATQEGIQFGDRQVQARAWTWPHIHKMALTRSLFLSNLEGLLL